MRALLAATLALSACAPAPTASDAGTRIDLPTADLAESMGLDISIVRPRDAPSIDVAPDLPPIPRDREAVDVAWSASPPPEACTQMGGGLCFVRPTLPIRSGRGPLNFSCPEFAETRTGSLTQVVVEVNDFLAQVPIPGAAVALSLDDRFASPTTVTANADGFAEFLLRAGTANRVNWRVQHPGYADTYTLFSRVPSNRSMHLERVFAIPEIFVSVVGGGVGVPSPAPRTGVVGGSVEDCGGNPLENAVVTLSSTSSAIPDDPEHYRAPTFVPGAKVFYFDNSSPTPRSRRTATSADGLFAILDAPETPGETRWYVQAWGHRTPEVLRLMSETRVRVIQNAIMLPEMLAAR